MKKLILFFLLMVSNLVAANAQNDTVFYIENCSTDVMVCIEKYDRIVIHGENNCEEPRWGFSGTGSQYWGNIFIIDETWMAYPGELDVTYHGCNMEKDLVIRKGGATNFPNSFTRDIWKRKTNTEVLEAIGIDSTGWVPFIFFNFNWSTGETTRSIEVTEGGTYTCIITDNFGCNETWTRTFIVRDNVEVSLATCDLETNHNMVTWPTTPEQAEYISTVKVKRDGIEVGTAPYIDGYFTDNIGSDAASRTYTVVGITPEGEECPITSYPKETIHMAYLTGMNNTIEVNWNIPTGYDLMGYNICEWNPDNKDGDLTVIDFVGAGVTSYTCSENQFDNGMVVVQGVENGRPESRLLSNRSWETVGIGEHTKQNFKIFPNPTNGSFTVEGTPTVTIYNILGQTVTTNHSENGTHTFTLRPGIYTVRNSDGLVRKVVVE